VTAVKIIARKELIKMKKANRRASLVPRDITAISILRNRLNAMPETFALLALQFLHKFLAQQVLMDQRQMVHSPQILSVCFVQLVLPVQSLEKSMVQRKLIAMKGSSVRKDNLPQIKPSSSVQKDTTVRRRVHSRSRASLEHSTHLYNKKLQPLVKNAQRDMLALDMETQQLTNLAKLATTVLLIVIQPDKRIVRKVITV
jgi:hypothetical protein